jgi:LuxR family maltose regulon positive regulatory protein
MNLSLSPLVLTKLRVPGARALQVRRDWLVEQVTSQDRAGCVLVCAPAGYGKTTLMVELAQALLKKGAAVAWYALDPGDDDPLPFKSYLIAAFIQALGPIPELTQLAQLLRASPEMDLPRILPAVINTLISQKQECALILDDYHQISAPAIHSALAYLIEQRPENLRIVIGSRSNPPLPLARLRARGQLLEIRTARLRFQEDETAQFLNEVMQLGLSYDGIRALEQTTEGWVTGLQLVALALSGREDKEQAIAFFTGSHRYLVEYLMEEVFSIQPPETQSFLLVTSVLERMCGDLCAALGSAQADSAQMLNTLEKANLFVIPLDEEGEWYRYHHLFRDFLQTRLKRTQPERIASLHLAACEWLAGKSLLREAARHAFQTGDWEYAAAFVEQHNFTLIVHGEIATIYEWCSAFPEETMQRHPMLGIMQAMALAYGFQRKNRQRVEALLQQAEQVIAALEDRDAAHGFYELACVVRTFLAFAPDPAAEPRYLLALTGGMLDIYPEGHIGQFSGLLVTGYAHLALENVQAAGEAFSTARQIALRERLYFGVVEATFHLACLAHSQGQLQRAADLCREGQADIFSMLASPERELPALGCLDTELGSVLMEQNQLDEAEAHLLQGLDWMGGGMNPYYLMKAYLALFRLAEIQQRTDQALKTLDRLEATWPDIAFCTRGLRAAHLWRAAPADPSRQAEAAAWCQEFLAAIDPDAPAPGLGPVGAAEVYYQARLAWSQIQIKLGNSQPALSTLQGMLEQAAANGLGQRVIELCLLLALGWKAEGDDERAWAALERALANGRAGGFIRTFDQGPALTRMLLQAAQQGLQREYVERILQAICSSEAASQGQAVPASPTARTPFGESLSPRELEVLQLIAEGATNQEIAGRLVITVGTVKSHVNHILGKLGAHNRTEAVARARELGWIEI